jgi:signal transduction histidine kinase/DNA-binding response OmpR family regulator
MDVLRALQLITDLAYVALGVLAIAAALRWRDRSRTDVALLFGVLAAAVVLQELLLVCTAASVCPPASGTSPLLIVLLLALPYLLMRLVDDVIDLPPAVTWATLALFVALSAAALLPGLSTSPVLALLLLIYLTAGTVIAAAAFGRRAVVSTGISRRRMRCVALGCGLLALTFLSALATQVVPAEAGVFTLASRLAGLLSGVCFYCGFFPPAWLSQAWRLPELLAYVRPPGDGFEAHTTAAEDGAAADAVALERLTAAVTITTGARRSLLVLEDPTRGDLFLWGAPSARIARDEGIVGRVLRVGQPVVLRDLRPEQLSAAVRAVFDQEGLPRAAIGVPILVEGRQAGVLVAYADKGPMFVKDDIEQLRFFANDAATILKMRQYRESAHELAALREADRLKDEFMAVVSHELRTPLTAISGYADILLRKLSGPLSERQERQVTGIRDATRRLLALINDLLDVSKLEAGTLDLHLAAVDPYAAIERAIGGTRVIAATKGVLLEVRAAEAPLPTVVADDERLQQILVNLLVNAIKFTPQGGRVIVGATAEPSEHGTDVVFRVEDTGVGIAAEQVGRVWDRFYQAESSSTRRFGGAGLGLSIVRRLAELHGGQAEAHSAGPDQGSTFVVRLPSGEPGAETLGAYPEPRLVTPAATSPASLESLPAAASGPPLVLVVEDDPDIAAVLRTYLEADGYAVEVAADGQLAVQAAREHRPFAITLDISLPKLDGWSVLNALKREPLTEGIPVVVVSIVDNKDFGMVLGATDYLVKPIDQERLRGILRELDAVPRPGDGTILVVDDDPAIRDVLGSSLVSDGWRVITAGDGAAALATLANERPAAMVLDLMMPRVDGFDVLRSVRADPATRELPVIVVTARELTDEDRAHLVGAAQRVITKQALSLDELRGQIRELLRSHRARARA